jgi:hypothetical protein
VWECKLDASGTGTSGGLGEHGSKISVYVKWRELLHQMSDCQFFKDSPPLR